MPIITFTPAPGKDFGLYFYGHRGTNNIDFCTQPSGVCTQTAVGLDLSAAYAIFGGGLIDFKPDVDFPFFRSMVPLSSYVLRVRDVTPLNVVGDSVAPTLYNIVPGLNTVYIDTNAIDFNINNFCNNNNTRVVYGTYDGSDVPNSGTPYFDYGFRLYTPALPTGAGNITTFRAGSAYIIDASASFTITYQRRSQYIITDSGTPNYPGYIITTNSGDRLTTGQVG